MRKVRISVHPGRRQLPELRLNDGRRPANDADASAIAVAAGTIGEAGFTSSVGLDPQLTFAAFVTGETNVLACNAAQRMAASEQPQFSPLYLKAATGQGKTHLLHAIGHAFLQAHPRARIFYCSAERFMVEFVRQADVQFITPDNPLGHNFWLFGIGMSQGQALSLPMIVLGLLILVVARWRAG